MYTNTSTVTTSDSALPTGIDNQPILPNMDTQVDSNFIKNTTPKVSNTKIIIIISLIVLLILICTGIYFIFKGGAKPSLTSNNVIVNNSKDTILVEKNNINHNLIAYINRDTNIKNNVNIYNLDTRQNLSIFDEINIKNELIEIGDWSPSGRYLPILAYNPPNTNYKTLPFSLYVYDVVESKLKKIYESFSLEDSSNTGIWHPSLNYGNRWLDDNNLVLENNKEFDKKISNIIYLNLSGVLKKDNIPLNYRLSESNSNIKLKYQYDIKMHKDVLNSISVNNKNLTFIPDGSVIGTIGNSLLTIIKPVGLDLRADDNGEASKTDLDTLNQEAERLRGQGLSDMEVSMKLLEFTEPRGETLIKFYDLNTGNVTNSFDISENNQWWTDGILIRSENNTLVAHQTDKMTLPTKERFIVIDPLSEKRTKPLFENLISSREVSGSFMLKNDTPFYLTNNGQWIIAYHERDQLDASIYIKNIETLEEINICETNCLDFSSYDSNRFKYEFEHNQ